MKHVKGFLLGPRPASTPCDCEPPGPIVGGTREPVGVIWVCEHCTRGWITYDPSSASRTCMHRSWREIGGRQLKKAIATIERQGHILTTRETWTPRDEPPTPPPPHDVAPQNAEETA